MFNVWIRQIRIVAFWTCFIGLFRNTFSIYVRNYSIIHMLYAYQLTLVYSIFWLTSLGIKILTHMMHTYEEMSKEHACHERIILVFNRIIVFQFLAENKFEPKYVYDRSNWDLGNIIHNLKTKNNMQSNIIKLG